MQEAALKSAQDYIRSTPYLIWYTTAYDQLSAESIVEGVLTTGDWHDYIKIESIFGLQETREIFHHLIEKKRSNLRPQTRTYFMKYFQTYA